MKKYLNLLAISLILLLTLQQNANAQIVRDTGELFLEISSIISDLPGNSGNDYSTPSPAQLNSWGSMLSHLLEGNYTEAASTANTIDYSLVEFLDTSMQQNTTYLLLKTNGSSYWGTYVYNPNFCRPLVIQSPHPRKDYNTGKQGIHIFKESGSFFFCLSGTSRCNHSAHSSCDGITSVCSGSPESYRISDMAHNVSTIFQSTTDTLFRKYNNTYFLQLHGFTKLSSDPYVILSNGTQITPSPDYIVPFSVNLHNEDPVLTFKIAHVNLSWTRLRGFSNKQGRLINLSSNPCQTNANNTQGRFIHMEQEKTRLRNNEAGWNKVANALINTFPCGPLPLSILNFEIEKTSHQTVTIKWESNPKKNTWYFTVERSKKAYDWEELSKVVAKQNPSGNAHYSVIDKMPYSGLSYYRLKQTDFDGKTAFSTIRTFKGSDTQKIIYPNPASKQISISGKDLEFETFKIWNIFGQDLTQRVKVILIEENLATFDISALPRGSYIFKTENFANIVHIH